MKIIMQQITLSSYRRTRDCKWSMLERVYLSVYGPGQRPHGHPKWKQIAIKEQRKHVRVLGTKQTFQRSSKAITRGKIQEDIPHHKENRQISIFVRAFLQLPLFSFTNIITIKGATLIPLCTKAIAISTVFNKNTIVAIPSDPIPYSCRLKRAFAIIIYNWVIN